MHCGYFQTPPRAEMDFNPYDAAQDLDSASTSNVLYSLDKPTVTVPAHYHSPLLTAIWDKAEAEWAGRFGH